MNTAVQNTAMTFQQFTQEIRAGVQGRFPEADILITPAEKNNGLTLTGLTVREEGRRVTPTIYLNEAYDSYKKGAALAELIAEVADTYRENRLEQEPEIPDFTDFQKIRDIVCCRLVNRERNRERLEKMPHRDFLDLAAIYYIPIEMGQDCSASLTMMDAHTAKWQVDAGTLFSLACANTERLFPASVRSMEKILQDLCPGSPSLHETGMHVLRNNGSGGAAAMLNEGVLQWFAGKYGDFYIFPSSVHEVILHPVKLPGLALEKEGLLDMVREINREQVPPDEVLSDNVYLYHADTGEIEILS